MGAFDTGHSLTRHLGIFSRTRPIRIAFILEDDGESQHTLDSVFSYAYSLWGGKRFLIVPAVSGEISEQYWLWLKVYDPDVVYSYCTLPDSVVEKINGEIQPLQLTEHKVHKSHSLLGLRPAISVHGLSSLSVLPAIAAGRLPGEEPATKILGFYDYRAEDRFIGDNFGGDLPLNPITVPALRRLVEPLAIVTSLQVGTGIAADNQIVGVQALLARMCKEQTVTLAQLSGLRIPDAEPDYRRPSSALEVVVGDTFVDRLTFWNIRLSVRVSEDRGLSALRIPAARVQEDDFIDTLCAFLKKMLWQLPGGWSGRPRINVRSHSIPVGELDKLVSCLRAQLLCPVSPPQPISGVETCCPQLDKSSRMRKKGGVSEFLLGAPISGPPGIQISAELLVVRV